MKKTLTEKALTPSKGKILPLNNKQIVNTLYGKRINIKCKNKKQKEFIKNIDDNEIVIGIGPAGVGKSYLSIIKALALLKDPNNNYQYIYVVTPAVEAEEKLGYLPGSIEEKLEPYLYSSYHLIDKIIGEKNRRKLIEEGVIRSLALAYLRGMNIDNTLVIFEEAQNSTPKQMKTFLTRIGFNSKFIITGDMEQSDRYKDIKKSGLYEAVNLLKDEKGIGVYKWVIEEDNEIVRNPIISRILKRYHQK